MSAPVSLLDRWQALVKPGTNIVFAEAEDRRVLQAAVRIAAETDVAPLLIGHERTIRAGLAQIGCRRLVMTRLDILHCPPTAGQARGGMRSIEMALALLGDGQVDACVVGARTTTAQVLQACLATFACSLNGGLVSSSMVMELPAGKVLIYADCAVVPCPTARQLAAIAVAAADEYVRLVEEEALIALLSASTLGSADHDTARRVRRGCAEARMLRPSLHVEGELQLDAALDESVAAIKAAGSSIAGRANVLIFPDLDAGNIAYKLTQHLTGARAYGPVLNGLPHVIVDLSRGCSAKDVYGSALAAAAKFSRMDLVAYGTS
jgi:phosphotransacetylase